MADPKERLLRKLIPPCTITGSASEGFKLSDQDSGWEIIPADDNQGAGYNYWAVWRGYFDLSGLVEQEETLFTINSAFQEGCDWAFTTTKPTGNLQVFDMITQEYLIDETFDGGNILTGSWVAPGMMGGFAIPGGTPRTGAPYELEDVHFGRARTFQYGAVTSLGASPFTPIQTRISSWGVGNATAGQKLYVTRAILLTPAMESSGNDSVIAPPSAVVVPSVILKEPDLHYIERLRRSYVVAPTVD